MDNLLTCQLIIAGLIPVLIVFVICIICLSYQLFNSKETADHWYKEYQSKDNTTDRERERVNDLSDRLRKATARAEEAEKKAKQLNDFHTWLDEKYDLGLKKFGLENNNDSSMG